LRFDVIARATVWGLLVPESIAYAGLAGLAPQAGLYTLLVTLAAYAVFGTSRHLVAASPSSRRNRRPRSGSVSAIPGRSSHIRSRPVNASVCSPTASSKLAGTASISDGRT
jgi:hypothetical protein